MGINERRAREKEELRQSILNAASELILEEGYQSLSIRKLAERIEYSPSTIYLYFKDKADILATICQEAFVGLSEKLDRIHSEEPDPRAALEQGLRCYMEWGLQHPNHYMVTFGTPWPAPIACDDAGTPTSSERAGLDCFAKLVAAVQRCIDAGQIPPGNTGLYAQVAWTSIHGLTSSLIVMKDDPHFPWAPREQLLNGMVNNVMAGLEAGAPARPTAELAHA